MARTRRQKLILWWWWRKRNILHTTRRFAVHPINRLRHIHGEYHHLMPQLLNDPERFAQYFRMKPHTFYDLLEHCTADLKEKSTNFCRAVSPEERLVVTLRFLATGESFRSLSFHFRLGVSTVRVIIKKTVKVLFKKLQPLHMPAPDENMWTKTAEEFFQRWNFLLCVGAIDGKHVQLKAPFHSGSQYYNYKSHHSIVLMAIVDANGKFLVIDVGGFGSCSDGGIFQDSSFFKLLKTNKLNLPKPAKIPNTGIELPYMFVGDEAFALMPNLMRPFPRRFLNNEKRIFNYRLSRARRQVECTFGVISSMWRIMRKPIEVEPNFATDMVKAVCVLHNYIKDKEPECTRELIQNDRQIQQWEGLPRDSGRARNEAMAVRNALMSYFLSPTGSLPWQTDLFTDVVEEIQRLHSTIQPLHEFHCGLDEVDKGAWLNSSLCQKLIQDQGLSNTSLQQYFFQRVAEITHSLGLSLGGWADGLILPGNQPFNRSLVPNEMVFANVWNNVWELGTSSHAYTMANMGYKVVMSHSTSLYFDHAQEPDWEERGFYWASRFIDSQKTFSFMPMNFYANIDTRRSGQPISREEVCGKDDINCPSLTKPQNIVGMQGHLWGDLIRTRDHMDSQLFPRMLALAERAWHHANWEKEQSTTVQHSLRMKDWYSYARAVGYQELPRLNGIGIKYRIPPPGAMVERKRLLVAPGYPLLTVEWSRDFGQTWHPVDGTERVENSERLWLRTRSANKQRCSRTVQLIPVGELQATAQQTLDYMGQHLHVTYEVADNYEQYGLSYYVVKLTLNNTGTQPIPGGNWQLHFPSVQWLEEGQLKEEKQFIIGEQGVALSHVQGYQFRLSPLPEFSPLENGMARVITFRGSYWSVSRYEQFPNYYVVAEGANARIIKNTKGESLSFVKDFAKVNQWKRDSTDKFDPLTPSARFSKQADVQDLGLAPHPYLPTPLHFEMDRSKTVSFAQGWVIVAPQEWKELADFLKDELKEKADLSVQQMAPASRYIELRQSSQDMPLSSWPGAYKLAVSPDRHTVLITATNITGALYGVQSLINMALQSVDGTTLFYVMATDSPRFPFRSMYLDVSRNFHTKHSVLAMLRAMGLYKLNKLHLHLADDEGWRLEIPGLPELTMIGSSRCHDPTEEQCLVPVMGSGPDPDNPGSGFYTIQDYQEILQAAAERHIEVIPEFDMPGHSRAAIKAMALRRQLKLEAGDFQGAHEYELDELGDHSKYSSVQLYNDNAVNPCLESSYRFIHHVIRQVKAIHANINPLRTYHFGGDEVASGAWVQSKACSEHVKQGVDLKLMFSVRVAALVATEGLNLAAWEDGIMDKGEPIPRLKMAPDQVFSNAWQNVWEWGNAARAYTLANHGYKVVMSQATHLYFDHPYEPSPEERGFYWATRYTDSRKTFLFQPEHLWLNVDMTRFGDPITLSQVCGKDNIGCPHLNLTNNVVGMQGHLWSETIRTARQLDYMIFPRFLAMAERAWHAAPWEGLESGADAEKLKDWTKFANTLGYNQLLVLDKLSIFYRVCPPGARREGLQVKVNTEFPGLKVQYLTSGFDQWQDVKAKQVDVKHGQTIQLRTLSADSKRASQPVMLEVPDINLDHASSGLSPPTLPCMSALIICLLVAWLHMLF